MELDAGSLLAGIHISEWTYSPTGRSEMKQGGIELEQVIMDVCLEMHIGIIDTGKA